MTASVALAAALARGLLVNAVRPDAVRVAPPLLVSDADIDTALTILRDILSDALQTRADPVGADGGRE